MDSRFAVITGASRGIGAEYARALGARGYNLLLVARDLPSLQAIAADIQGKCSSSVEVESIDLAVPNAAHQLYSATRHRSSTVDMLVNNAGFGMYGNFSDMPLQKIQQMLQLHVGTIVESTRLILPSMIERGSGTIINVSSIAGLFPLPFLAEYSATKAFLVSFSEALAEEVRPLGIVIQACCPGQTDTNFHKVAGFKPLNPLGMQTAQEVVQTSLSALNKASSMVTIGWQGTISALLAKWAPRRFVAKQVAKQAAKWVKPF